LPAAILLTGARKFPKARALEIFKEREEPLKCELIDEKAGEIVSVYYIDNSPFIDFCLGPHVPEHQQATRLQVFVTGRRLLESDATQPQSSASTAPAFFSPAELDAWLKQREEAEKRDHRRLAANSICSQFRNSTAGVGLLASQGRRYSQRDEDYLRGHSLAARGLWTGLHSAHLPKRDLWFISGHEEKLRPDSMFSPMEFEGQEFRHQADDCDVRSWTLPGPASGYSYQDQSVRPRGPGAGFSIRLPTC